MAFTLPTVVKQAERFLLEVETAVRRFSRYHKYSYGADLRRQAMRVARLAHRAWRDAARRRQWTDRLIFEVDDIKLTLQLGKQIESFASFEQWEAIARIAADLGRQCGGWKKSQHAKGQNATAGNPPAQRAQILSARAAEGASI